MTRAILYSRMLRGLDADAGGAADLQTDVMRFMAILSLCLVAIFALVQSLPMEPRTLAMQAPTPPPEVGPSTPVEPAQVEVTPRPVASSKTDAAPVAVTPKPRTESRPPPAAVARPVADKVVPATPVKPQQPAESKVAQEEPVLGFTLQFATDSALTALVAADRVGLYAIADDLTVRMAVEQGQPTFWPASLPNQYHEMDEATVPIEIAAALNRAGFATALHTRWGVTLPNSMSRSLDQILQQHQGGSLVIDGSGQLRLEQ